MTASSAMGAFTFTNGDLVLGFQATAGTGATTNVFFNLGSGVNARDGVTSGVLGNISTTLTSAFGATWYDRSDVYFGIIGNLNSNAAAPVNGDATRTFYWSRPTGTTPESSSAIPAGTYSQATLSSIGTNFGTPLAGMEGMLVAAAGNANLVKNADNSLTMIQSSAPVEWNSGWTNRNPTPGAAFNSITGGIQQNFGKVDATTYLDLHRIVNTNTGTGVVPGVIGGSQYVMTFAISETGDISVVPEPSSALLGSLGVLALFRRRRA